MRRNAPWFLVGLSLLVVAFSNAPRMAMGQEKNGGTKIGFVNLMAAAERYPKATKLMDELKAVREKDEQVLVQLKTELEDLEAESKMYKADSTKAAAVDLKIAQKMAVFEMKARQANQQQEKKRLEVGEQIYGDLTKALQALAQKDGYQLVLKADPHIQNSRFFGEFLASMHARNVLYYDKNHDLTDALVKSLGGK